MSTINVMQYGAVGGGVVTTANGPAFQNAINACAAAGGGTVLVPWDRFYFDDHGYFSMPAGVSLIGDGQGPYEPSSDPSTTTWGPTLLVTTTAAPFITHNGDCTIANLIFYYPHQVAYNSSVTPTAYSWTIYASPACWQGQKVQNNTFVNAYLAILTHAGRNYIENNIIGAIIVGLRVDGSADVTFVRRNVFGPVWDYIFAPSGFPQALDAYVQSVLVALQFFRADENILSDNFVLSANIGIDIEGTDAGTHISSWAQASNTYIEAVNIGVRANSTNSQFAQGWNFTNLVIAPTLATSITAIQMNQPPAGFNPPWISVSGGDFSGGSVAFIPPQRNDASAAVPGRLWLSGIMGYTPVGWLDGRAGVPALPPVPPKDTGRVTNTTGVDAMVYISTGAGVTVSYVVVGTQQIPGTALAQNATLPGIRLPANQSIGLGYAGGTPTWAWALD